MIFYNKELVREGRDRRREPAAGDVRRVPRHRRASSSPRRPRRPPSTRRRAASSSSPGSTSTRCSRPRPAASNWSRTARRRSTPTRARRSPTFWKTHVRREARAARRSTTATRSPTARPRWRSSARGPIAVYERQGQLGRRPGADLGRQAGRTRSTRSPTRRTSRCTRACKNRGTAWDVLKFATSEEQDGKLLETTGQMPLRKDLHGAYADYFTKNPDYKAFADQAARTVEVPNVPNSIEIWQTFRDAYSKSVIFGKAATSSDGASDGAAHEDRSSSPRQRSSMSAATAHRRVRSAGHPARQPLGLRSRAVRRVPRGDLRLSARVRGLDVLPRLLLRRARRDRRPAVRRARQLRRPCSTDPAVRQSFLQRRRSSW